MPVYEYECKGCGHEFEKQQRITDAPAKKCPSCGAMKARRLISHTSFILKGSGWYNDLYSSSSGKKDKKDKKDADTKDKSGTKGESKSEASGKGGSKSKAKSKSGKSPGSKPASEGKTAA